MVHSHGLLDAVAGKGEAGAGAPNAPGPLRSERHPAGLPHLGQADRAKVEEANELVDFFATIMEAAHEAGAWRLYTSDAADG